MTEVKKNLVKIDYLTEDEPLRGQNYAVVSIVSANFELEDKSLSKTLGFKIRGVYETMEQAQKRAKHLQTVDPMFNIFISEVGKWIPFEDNPSLSEETVYGDEKLNALMKEYLDSRDKAGKELEYRRKEDIAIARKKAEEHNKLYGQASTAENPVLDIEEKKEDTVDQEEKNEMVRQLERDVVRAKEILGKK